MKQELMQKLAGTVAPLSDAELENVVGGGKGTPDAGQGIEILQYTYSLSRGESDDCSDAHKL
jgi:hypothetical protein